MNRPILGETIQGWINAYSEGDWLPKWASPGYRTSMPGSMGDVPLSDAIVNDIPGFDITKAYEAIRKDAMVLPPEGAEGVGRTCLISYLTYGYIAKDAMSTLGSRCYEVVSESLNYLQADYAISMAAKKLGHYEDAAVLAARAANYTKLFDSETGFFRSKVTGTEKWSVPFDQVCVHSLT